MMKLQYLLIVAAAVACSAKDTPPPPSEAAKLALASTTVAASGAAPGGITGSQSHARSCPAGLPHSHTRIAMTPRGVDVTVTSEDPEVQRRIVALAGLDARSESAQPHDQQLGRPVAPGIDECPIIRDDITTVTMTQVTGGAILHVDARSPLRVEELQAMVKARAERLPGFQSS